MAGFEKEACHRLLRAAHGIIRVGADCLVRTRGLVLCIVFTATLLGAVGRTFAASEIEVFTREGCPHCRDARPFLKQLQRERPDLNIVYRDVEQDPAALSRLREIAGQKGEHALGVPAFFINDELIIGFGSAETTGTRILEALDRGKENLTIRLPLMGPMGVSDLGLPAFTVTIGLLDGFNPCAMWVLLFLLSLLVNLGSRFRVLLIGGVFVFVSGLVYFLFMAAWLNIFLLVGYPRATQIVLAIVAGIVGVINVKDFFAFRRGLSLTIPESTKPGIYARARHVLMATSTVGAIAGAAILALLVNVIELACTAGLPALYTQILSVRALPPLGYYGYLALYNLAYILDDMLVLAIAVATLSRFKLQERGGRWLKLLSGMVMLALGVLLLARPEWLMV
jgi:glutaredoxin